MTNFKKLLKINCVECKEIKIYFWIRRCKFCDVGEGLIK